MANRIRINNRSHLLLFEKLGEYSEPRLSVTRSLIFMANFRILDNYSSHIFVAELAQERSSYVRG